MGELNSKNFDAATKSGNVVVDFWGEGCGNCKMMAPFLVSLEAENPNVKFVKVDTGAATDLVTRFNITTLPTLVFMQNGTVKETLVGLKPRGVLARTIDQLFK